MQNREIMEHVGKDGVITESDVEKMSYLNALSALFLHPLSLTLSFFLKKRGWLRPWGWPATPNGVVRPPLLSSSSFFLSFFFFFLKKIKKINILMYKKRCVLKNVTAVNKIGRKDFMIGVDVPMPLFVKKKNLSIL
jgi:hypothetical protein